MNKRTRSRKENRKRSGAVVRLALSFAVLAAVVLTAGCGPLDRVREVFRNLRQPEQKISLSGGYVFRIGDEECSPQEARVILLNYQKEYGELYGIDMWAYEDGGAQNLKTFIRDLTLSQLAEVYALNVIAREEEITLDREETERAAQAAEAYYSGLTEAETDYLGITEQEAEALYGRYALADKLYRMLTQNVDREVSDDEARVMQLKQIYTTDGQKAQEIYRQLTEGKNFDTLAESESEADSLYINVNRSMFPEEASDRIFALEENGISDVIETEDGYYIFYCVNAFNQNLTNAHKQAVVKERTDEVLQGVYDSYQKELSSELDGESWQAVTVDTSLKTDSPSFLEVYGEYFGNPS